MKAYFTSHLPAKIKMTIYRCFLCFVCRRSIRAFVLSQKSIVNQL